MITNYDQWKTSSPYDDEHPCEICGEFDETCICPECPECGSIGDPDCYKYHGLKRTEEQKFSLYANEIEWKRENYLYWQLMRET